MDEGQRSLTELVWSKMCSRPGSIIDPFVVRSTSLLALFYCTGYHNSSVSSVFDRLKSNQVCCVVEAMIMKV